MHCILNDGHRLTVEFNKGDDLLSTTRMINVDMVKKEIEEVAGEFGTGLRSAHAISHTIEVTGKITRYDHVSDDENGSQFWRSQISKQQSSMLAYQMPITKR